jgi:CBS domain
MKTQAILSEGGYCTPQTPLAGASRIMRDRNRQWLPLIGQEGKAVDVITDRDICMAVANRCLPDMTIAAEMAPAIAVVRGNPTLRTALVYKWTEPYVVPKRSLTGSTTERVDTRVMQVVFSFERTHIPVFVGQQMDVFIQAAAIHGVTGTHSWCTDLN